MPVVCCGCGWGCAYARGGDRYKPSALSSYERSLNTHVFPRLGRERLSEVSRTAIQDLVDEMVAAGCGSSTSRNVVLPLRATYVARWRARR